MGFEALLTICWSNYHPHTGGNKRAHQWSIALVLFWCKAPGFCKIISGRQVKKPFNFMWFLLLNIVKNNEFADEIKHLPGFSYYY